MTPTRQQTAPVGLLREHPRNEGIYGPPDPAADAELAKDVGERGIVHPIVVTGDWVVVSGHRRLRVAKALGLAEVPVSFFLGRDDLDVLEALVSTNAAVRNRTNEQMAREAQLLMEVERERARRRQQEAGKRQAAKLNGQLQEHVPEAGSAGQARDKVGKAIGTSGKTVERLVKAVSYIDEREAAGDLKEAQAVREALNRKSVRAAERAIGGGNTPPADTPLSAAAAAVARCRRALGELRKAMQEAAEMSGGEELRSYLRKAGGGRLTCDALDELAETIRGSAPRAEGCPDGCGNSPACLVCLGRGWVCLRVWKQLDEDARSRLSAVAAPEDG